MNFFKSSFFSDLKLQDVLEFSQEDDSSTARLSENLLSTDKEESVATPDANGILDIHLGNLISPDAEGIASKNGSGAGSDTSSMSCKGQQEEDTGTWSLGSLVKSITSKSEGLIKAYRKDLEEFGSGLKKETQIIAEVAAHAVKDLPTSLETGAYKAQESIETVGQVVEEFSSSVWRGTVELIAQGKEAVLKVDEDEGSTFGVASSSSSMSRYDNPSIPISGGKYSRFEAQVRAMQHDSSTYCNEPYDLADYTTWKSTFSLSDKKQDIDVLLTENTLFKELLIRFVPNVVSEEMFWTRYFYRLHKLQQTEEARADLVKRASALEEEDLSWDTEEEPEEAVNIEHYVSDTDNVERRPNMYEPIENLEASNSKQEAAAIKVASQMQDCRYPHSTNHSENVAEEEDDLGWEVPEDEEESSSNDSKRSSNSEASWEVPDVSKEEVQKKFSAQDDEEADLSWDVDDGAEDTK